MSTQEVQHTDAAGSAWKTASVHRRRQCPGRVRPARPARCAALALLMGAVISASKPLSGLYSFTLA